jgi:hypothetical protein
MSEAALHSPDAQYLSAVEREEEMARLEAQAQKRKSMLVFGPEGVGKTRLLHVFVDRHPLALYVPRISTPRDLMLSLIGGLRNLDDRALLLPSNPGPLSTPSLKGIVMRALAVRPFVLVLDHLAGPSRVITGIIKEFTDYGKRPVIFAARSPHMEDIGTLQPLCADRSERLELKNLTPSVAIEFARREAERSGLWASNLEPALRSFVEWSEGNPGSILHMLRMTTDPRYQMGDQIKAHILWLDFRMGRQKPR